MADKPQGAGSIWNVNSWHWENKNYTKPAKTILTQILLATKHQFQGIDLSVTQVSKIQGDADVNIRKGKQILVFDFTAQVQFVAEKGVDQVTGTFTIREFNGDDIEDLQLDNINLKEKNPIGQAVKTYLRKDGPKFYRTLLKTFKEDLAKFESDPAKLQKDRELREQAAVATRKAREQRGAEKERLLQQQKQKQRKMKEEFYLKQKQRQKKQ